MKPVIPDQEYKERVKKTQESMKKNGIDLLFCFGNEAEPQYVRYYSNYAPLFESSAVLIPVEGEPILLIGPESETLANEFSKISEIKKILSLRESSEPEYPGAQLDKLDEVIKNLLKVKEDYKVGLVGSSIITKNVFDELQFSVEELGAVDIVKSDQIVSEIKEIKSSNELACMQEAYNILQYAFEEVLKNIEQGMTENEVKGIALKSIYEKGGESEGYPFWILTGKGSNKPVGKINNKKIQEGDLVHVQLGARYEGYVASLGRAIVVGEPTSYQENLIKAGLEVQKEILKEAKPGIEAKRISEIHYDTLKKLGFEDHILYGPCHGTGLMENEHPWIESNSNYKLKSGMTFCTCLYLGNDEKEVGIRIEDGFYITEKGAQLFADHNRDVLQV